MVVKKLSRKGLFPFLVLFVTSIVVSGFFFAKVAESISYQRNIDRAVETSKETSVVQGYLISHPNAQSDVRQDSYCWIVLWHDPTTVIMHVLSVYIDKGNWKVVKIEEAT
jgi:hypothetical protein